MPNLDHYLALATFALALISSLIYTVTRIAKIEFQVNLLWEYVMKRALTGAISNDLGQFNSPFVIHEDIAKLYDGMKEKLIEFYQANKNDNYVDLFIGFGSTFGERILNEIALPNKMDYAECIFIAVHIGKGD